ncbi:MAG: GDSL-type esterase/lipase family protein [Burkholderiaceae bacterium]
MTFTEAFARTSVVRRIGRAAVALLVAGAAAAAGASDERNRGSMLALGDSVVFGYIAADGPGYLNPDNFLAYPDLVGDALKLDVANASCPGETAAGLISLTGADNGCRPYRARFPLHVAYGATQLDYALAHLAANRRTRLVTLSIGANDGFLLQAACNGDPACIQQRMPAALNTLFANVNTILANVRASGFKGVLMVVNYYSLDYGDPAQTGLSAALNQTLAAAAGANGAVVADAFTAFRNVAAAAGGKTCFTGLLNGDPANQTQCDVHPSLSGQRLLAATVAATYRAVRRGDD